MRHILSLGSGLRAGKWPQMQIQEHRLFSSKSSHITWVIMNSLQIWAHFRNAGQCPCGSTLHGSDSPVFTLRKTPILTRGPLTSSSCLFVSSSILRMSSIVRSTHLSSQQNSCLWKFVNRRFSCYKKGWTQVIAQKVKDTNVFPHLCTTRIWASIPTLSWHRGWLVGLTASVLKSHNEFCFHTVWPSLVRLQENVPKRQWCLSDS